MKLIEFGSKEIGKIKDKDDFKKMFKKKYAKAKEVDLFADVKEYTKKEVKKDIAGVWD